MTQNTNICMYLDLATHEMINRFFFDRFPLSYLITQNTNGAVTNSRENKQLFSEGSLKLQPNKMHALNFQLLKFRCLVTVKYNL